MASMVLLSSSSLLAVPLSFRSCLDFFLIDAPPKLGVTLGVTKSLPEPA